MNSLPKLLIVEDDDDLREVMVDSLCSMNVQLLVAENGFVGLQMIESLSPDAVLSDLNMPKMNGLEMLKNLRQKGMQTPVVLLSGYKDEKNSAEAQTWGVLDFLDKPCHIEELIVVLEKAIELGIKINQKTVPGAGNEV